MWGVLNGTAGGRYILWNDGRILGISGDFDVGDGVRTLGDINDTSIGAGVLTDFFFFSLRSNILNMFGTHPQHPLSAVFDLAFDSNPLVLPDYS